MFQAPDLNGQQVSLKLHHDGHLGSFEGSSGTAIFPDHFYVIPLFPAFDGFVQKWFLNLLKSKIMSTMMMDGIVLCQYCHRKIV